MIAVILHPLNYYAGWGLVLAGFAVGAGLGLFFHRDEFRGGYSSFWRRLTRLGHIALVALGLMNVLVSVAVPESGPARAASILFVVGGITMPAMCFLTAWWSVFRHGFFVPVIALLLAVVFTLIGGTP